jgi:hypothetical protein
MTMSDADTAEAEAFTLEDAVYIARDGIELLECVDHIDTSKADEGALLVTSERGTFTVEVRLEQPSAIFNIAEQHGGTWGSHPDFPLADWQHEVSNNETRLGYWDWVAGKLEDAMEDQGDDGPFVHTPA